MSTSTPAAAIATSAEQKRQIERVRRFLKADLGRASLMNCAPSPCVRKESAATAVLFHVTEKDCVITFEQRGADFGHFKLIFVSLAPISTDTASALDQIARQFILDMLQSKGFEAVAMHRYDTNAPAILEAARRLMEQRS